MLVKIKYSTMEEGQGKNNSDMKRKKALDTLLVVWFYSLLSLFACT